MKDFDLPPVTYYGRSRQFQNREGFNISRSLRPQEGLIIVALINSQSPIHRDELQEIAKIKSPHEVVRKIKIIRNYLGTVVRQPEEYVQTYYAGRNEVVSYGARSLLLNTKALPVLRFDKSVLDERLEALGHINSDLLIQLAYEGSLTVDFIKKTGREYGKEYTDKQIEQKMRDLSHQLGQFGVPLRIAKGFWGSYYLKKR